MKPSTRYGAQYHHRRFNFRVPHTRRLQLTVNMISNCRVGENTFKFLRFVIVTPRDAQWNTGIKGFYFIF